MNKEKKEYSYIQNLIKRYPLLASVEDKIGQAYEILETCFQNDNKLLVAGNGGSCADAEHIVGELMKGFKKSRKLPEDFAGKLKEIAGEQGEVLADSLQGALQAIALHNHQGLNTAFMNDINGDYMYAQQVYGYGRREDVFLAISTSGNAKNIMAAAAVAKAKGMRIIALTGKDGGELGKIADCAIIVPNQETYEIQEYHLPIYHCLCLMLEERFFE